VTSRLRALRRSEQVIGAYFLYVAALVVLRGHAWPYRGALACLIPAGLFFIAQIDRGPAHRVWSVVRDWMPAALVLVAYWSIDWAPRAHGSGSFEHTLVGWDRMILNDWGLRAGIERFGALVPSVFEAAYLLLYALLPLIIAAFYARHERHRLEDFLFPFLLGTLVTYALLPHFPSQGPRFAFPGQDLPGIDTLLHRVNLWVLDHGDIRSSVFPSGHVAVGFSAAFAVWLAVPAHRGVGWTLLAAAVLVWITTIYGRYHYAADGLASLVVTGASIALIKPLRSRASPCLGRDVVCGESRVT
jgi:membrane-associated phospholipid phosphatase